MARRDMFDSAEIGIGNFVWRGVEEKDAWWTKEARDYEALALFWCPDLRDHTFRLAGDYYWEVRTPSGKRVAYGNSRKTAWRITLAMIHYHLKRERMKELIEEAGRRRVVEIIKRREERG